MNIEKFNSSIAELRKSLDTYTDGWANVKARGVAMSLCDSISSAAVEYGYITEKIHDIKDRVDRIYSARKHTPPGVGALRADIESLLRRIEAEPGIAERIKSFKKEP